MLSLIWEAQYTHRWQNERNNWKQGGLFCGVRNGFWDARRQEKGKAWELKGCRVCAAVYQDECNFGLKFGNHFPGILNFQVIQQKILKWFASYRGLYKSLN